MRDAGHGRDSACGPSSCLLNAATFAKNDVGSLGFATLAKIDEMCVSEMCPGAGQIRSAEQNSRSPQLDPIEFRAMIILEIC
ncbi:hypothetical protein J2Z31_000181 [Sinorhizobium kostiense]|uniref:Uncharacterized protein n=1 Tax=Sinorhizobium kostiense TaxID=76747 RepID=A0ABS4QSQ4_9HYPH|nr:hypothetical protein [Sinorhizobium kostiense]